MLPLIQETTQRLTGKISLKLADAWTSQFGKGHVTQLWLMGPGYREMSAGELLGRVFLRD